MKPSPLKLGLQLACGAALIAAAACSSKSNGGPVDAGPNPLCYGAAEDVLSDFTNDNGINPTDGRRGGWYTYADKSGLGTLDPKEGSHAEPDPSTGNPTCSGPGALKVLAMNFTDWGAAMGVDFMPTVPDDSGAQVKGTYDASKYRGVAFWAKSAAEPIRFVQVKFTDPWTDIPSILPGDQRCVNNNMAANNCSPYIVKFGYGWEATGQDGGAQDPTVATTWPRYATDKVDTGWKRFEVLFADTRQDPRNPGQSSPGNQLDVTKLMGMGIQVNSDHSTVPPTPNDFEIWIDDVTFIK